MSDFNSFDLTSLSAEELALIGQLLADEGVDLAQAQSPTVQSRPDVLPLSFAQERLWFLDQFERVARAYNTPVALRLGGSLDVAALQHSINEIVRRHEVLRTTFALHEGQPIQIVNAAAPVPLTLIDLCDCPADQRDQEVQRYIWTQATRRFDLQHGPLLYVTLLQLAADLHVLLLVMHHIVSDDWSLGVWYRELAALYSAALSRQPAPLADLPLQYVDYALWQRNMLQGERLEAQLDYWRQQLAGMPQVLDLPTDRPRPELQTFQGTTYTFTLSPALSQAVKQLCEQEHVTLFQALLAAFQVLLARYTRQTDIVVGTPIANRTHAEFEPLIGFFLNMLLLRVKITDNLNFRQLLQHVRAVTLAAYAHQDLPFEKLVEELQPERDLSRPPLAQVLFTLHTIALDALQLPGVTVQPEPIAQGTAKFDLSLSLEDSPHGLLGVMEYNTDLFDRSTIVRMMDQFQMLLQRVVANPEQPVLTVPLLSAVEMTELLVTRNQTSVPYPQSACLHHLIEQQVARTPDACAVVFGDHRLSYAELNDRANQLAHFLGGQGVAPGARVGLCLHRSLHLPVAVLAILKAGGAFVPLDPSFPTERMAYILDDSGVLLAITTADIQARLPDHVPLLCLDTAEGLLTAYPVTNPSTAVTAADLAYLIYTSGSTGKPKGVLIPHQGIVNYVYWCADAYGAASGRGAPVHASIAADAIFPGLFAPLCVGSAVLIFPEDQPLAALAHALVTDGNFSFIKITPSQLEVLEQSVPDRDATGWTNMLVVGAEAVRSEVLRFWQQHAPTVPLLNEYGPTETVVGCSIYRFPPAASFSGAAPLGLPIPNLQFYVLDAQMQPVPIGVPGELYIGGVGVAWGYHNRPALTAEKFVPDPFSAEPGARLYRSGDVARYLEDRAANIAFLGRSDDQVKIRGYRVEIGEIEAMLDRHPALREVVVLAREVRPGEQRLVAYVVANSPAPTVAELRQFLQVSLPEYMIPSAFVFLDAIPLAPHGKIDRSALPLPEFTRDGLDTAHVAPRTPAEGILASIWSEVLQIERVGVHDNFFELGGHSLLGIQIIVRVREAFQLHTSLSVLFEAPTVAGMAERLLAAQQAGAHLPTASITRLEPDIAPQLSFAQERLWFLDQFAPGNTNYNITLALRLHGPLDVAALHQSLTTIVERQAVLRTTFAQSGVQPAQVIAPSAEVALPLLDLLDVDPELREHVAYQQALAAGTRPFDLRQGPLFHAALLRLDATEHVLVLAFHHIIFDAWSTAVLYRELSMCYAAYRLDQPPALPNLTIQYADYAHWQRGWLQDSVIETQLSYWRQQLANLPVLNLATDLPRPAVQTYHGALATLDIPAGLATQLNALSRREGVTLFMTLLAAWQIVLARYSGQDDIVVGTPVAGRTHAEVEPLIGFFVNMLVLRANLQGQPTFRDLLRQVRATSLEAYTHQDLPFERLVEALQPERDMSRSPLVQVVFTLQNTAALPTLPEIAITPIALEHVSAKFDLTLIVEEHTSGLHAILEYNTDLFLPQTIQQMLGNLHTLLEALAADPGQHLVTLPLLTAAEQQLLLTDWNTTTTDYPQDAAIHRLFELQVAQTPEAIALVEGEMPISYHELNCQANRLAHYLQTLGVGPETCVGVCLPRSVELIVALLGILKAGGAYVPLDLAYPSERLQFMLDDAQVAVLLTLSTLRDSIPGAATSTICLDTERSTIERMATTNPVSHVGGDYLAYVCYTSGSTGQPKGVSVIQRSVVRLVKNTSYVSLTPAETLLQFAPVSFDAATFEIWGALLNGARLAIFPAHQPTLDELGQFLQAQNVTTLWLTAGLFHQMIDNQLSALRHVRQLLAGGDVLSGPHVQRLVREVPDCQVINGYGPTENTTFTCCYCAVDPDAIELSVPIGRPIANTQVYILDRHLQAVPRGVVGELYIGGDGLARAYVHQPALTAERFVPNPFANLPGSRLYKTGDLVRYLADGNIEFLGRIDRQIKLRGFRIELGEIEAMLGRHPQVQSCIVATHTDANGNKQLVAYVVAHRAQTATLEPSAQPRGTAPDDVEFSALGAPALRAFLQDRLPEYMIPSLFMLLDSFPLTANGKIDRGALPAPDAVSPEVSDQFVAPRTPVEEVLAALWADILDVPQVGVHDDFFELGGHSLLATQITARIRTLFKIDVPLRSLFEAATVDQFARELAARETRPGHVERVAVFLQQMLNPASDEA